MEGERCFHLYLLSLYTIVFPPLLTLPIHHTLFLILYLELCQNAKCQNENTKIEYSKAELLNPKPKAHTTRMGTDTCNHIENLKIKQNFRRKRGGQTCWRIWNNNKRIYQNLLRPLNRSDKTLWNSTKVNMALTNIQFIKPKLDMLISHMLLNNLDISFITETWTQCGNEPEYQYIRANLDTAGYNIIIHSRDMYDLHQHINRQTHKLGNALDWLISNSPETIQDITSKNFLSNYSIIKWKFQISQKVTEKCKQQEETYLKSMRKALWVTWKTTLM